MNGNSVMILPRPTKLVSAMIAVCLLAGSCGKTEPDAAVPTPRGVSRPTVYVVNYPLQYFAQRIGGAHVDVHFPAPADEDPAYWRPDDATIADYQQADLILLNGAGYASWINQATLPPSRLVDTSAAFHDRYIHLEGTTTHTHGPAGAHAQGDIAFTTWLDPQFAIEQVGAIRKAFVKRWPEHESDFNARFNDLQHDLEEIDDEIARIVSGIEERPIIVSHPVYQYLARRYGLNVVSVHWEPDEELSAAMWRELEGILADHPATIMLWESAPFESVSAQLDEHGVSVVVFDPCANAPPEGDFLSVWRANVVTLRDAYSD